MNDPASSGFPSPEQQAAFEAQGEVLLAALRRELGAAYEGTHHLF